MWPIRRRRRIRVRPGALTGPNGVIAQRVTWCMSVRERFRGVLGRPPLDSDEAYVIAGARQVHTEGVPYPLDAVFCDVDWCVLHVETMQPMSRSKRVAEAFWVVELLGGRASAHGVVPGDRLSFEKQR